jgi:hypothetical protein
MHYLVITALTPHSPDRTGYDSMILYPKEVASDPRYANDREDILDNDWVFASKEDAVVCKKVQEGRHSTAFDQHFYAPFWESMSHSFCNRILDDLEKNE